jgi:hypothetical protein
MVVPELKLAAGAAGEAPTAPHATPRAGGKRGARNGPERFWDARRMRIAFRVALIASLVGHFAAAPFKLLPTDGFDINDTDGEATLPIEVIEDQTPPPPAQAEQAEPPKDKTEDPNGAFAGDAAAMQTGASDAGPDGSRLFSPDDGGGDEAGLDAGDAATSDPVALANDVKAGDPLVLLVLNMEAIRNHQEGRKLGGILSAIPQWDDFMSGTNVDPVRDADWVMISGPSLVHTDKDIILVHYSAQDAVIDNAMNVVASKWQGHGGPYDAGVPGVTAVIGHADGSPRVFLRPQPHLIAVVPVDVAHNNASLLKRRTVAPPIHPGEAFFMRLLFPQHVFPDLPATVKVVRMRIYPRDDGSADVEAEGDCSTPAEAQAAADTVRSSIQQRNTIIVTMMTHGLLDGVEVTSQGSQMILKLHASQDQLEVLAGFAEQAIASIKSGGGMMPPAPGGSSPPGQAPPPPPPPAPPRAPTGSPRPH